MPVFERSIELPVSAADAFHLHERPDILERLTPPGEGITIVKPPTSLRAGTRVEIRMKVAGPISVTWLAHHTRYEPPHLFEDVQEKGPFSKWVHQHRFEDVPGKPRTCRLTDHVEYELLPRLLAPFGWLGDALVVRRRLEKMFAWRHAQTLALAREL
jgi:uncharacterized protein